MALVLLVAGRWPAGEEADETRARSGQWVSLTSKWSLEETVRQIERAARANGLPVLARAQADVPAGATQDEGRFGPPATAQARVLVLGDEAGHTPMWQAHGQAMPELPWRVLVHQRDDGQTEVHWGEPGGLGLPDGVIPGTQARLQAWSHSLRAALT